MIINNKDNRLLFLLMLHGKLNDFKMFNNLLLIFFLDIKISKPAYCSI